MPKNRRLAPAISPATPSARMVTGIVKVRDGTNRIATLQIGNALVKVHWPISMSTPAINDVMWCIETSGHYWPVGFDR